MNDEKLRELLEELHMELLQLEPTTGPLQEKRDALAEQIREALDQDDLGGYHLSLGEVINEELASFAEAHPNVAKLMNAASDLLSAIGI